MLDALDDDDRYADPDLTVQTHPGEIAPEAIARLQGMVADRLLDRDAFARWFGRFATAPKNADIDWQPESRATAATLRRALARGTAVLRNPASRFAFVAGDADAVTLFVDGEAYRCEGALAACARELCADARVTFNPGVGDSDAAVELFAELLDRGCIAFDPEGLSPRAVRPSSRSTRRARCRPPSTRRPSAVPAGAWGSRPPPSSAAPAGCVPR